MIIMVPVILTAGTLTITQAISDVTSAIRKGDASAIAKMFDTSVDITILDDEDSYSKSQGEQVLKQFFSSNKPSSFTIKHDGSSPGGDEFVIGDMVASGKTFRVYVLFKQSGKSPTIQELRIEKK